MHTHMNTRTLTKFGANEKISESIFWAYKNFNCLNSLVILRKGEKYETTTNR